MSEKYTDLTNTKFPNGLDDFEENMDMPVTDTAIALVKQYKGLMAEERYEDAQKLVDNDETHTLSRILINAKDINQMKNAIMAIERMWNNDLHTFVDGMGYQGEINTITFSHIYDVTSRTHNFSPTSTYIDPTDGSTKLINITGAIVNGRVNVAAAYHVGDKFAVNGNVVEAYVGNDLPDEDTLPVGKWVCFIYDGKQINFKNGGGLTNVKLAAATATTEMVCEGVPFYAGDKTLKYGTMTLLHDNVTPDKVLEGITFHGGLNVGTQIGTMKDNGAWSAHIAAGGSATIPEGNHNGRGVVTATPLAQQTPGTAVSSVILNNFSGWVNGEKVVGNMPNNGAWGKTLSSGESVKIPYGCHSGAGSITAPSASVAAAGHGICLIHNGETYRLPSGKYQFVAGIGGMYNDQAENKCYCRCGLGGGVKWSFEQPGGVFFGIHIFVNESVSVADDCLMQLEWGSANGTIGAFYCAYPIG